MQGSSNNNLLQVPDGKRVTTGSKAGSKVSSKRGKKSLERAKSTTSSARIVLLEGQLKLIEEEQKQRELEVLEQQYIRKRLIEEKRVLQQRKYEEELEAKRQQQRIRQESLEKRKEIIRQVAETSSRASSITDVDSKVSDWLSKLLIPENPEPNPPSTEARKNGLCS